MATFALTPTPNRNPNLSLYHSHDARVEYADDVVEMGDRCSPFVDLINIRLMQAVAKLVDETKDSRRLIAGLDGWEAPLLDMLIAAESPAREGPVPHGPASDGAVSALAAHGVPAASTSAEVTHSDSSPAEREPGGLPSRLQGA